MFWLSSSLICAQESRRPVPREKQQGDDPAALALVLRLHFPERRGASASDSSDRGAESQPQRQSRSAVSVPGRQTIFIDPFVAIGYDYAIGAGDPNFASVRLPNVGDGNFDLIFGNTATTIQADTQFFFPPGEACRSSASAVSRLQQISTRTMSLRSSPGSRFFSQ
jgi:hypothetical protein